MSSTAYFTIFLLAQAGDMWDNRNKGESMLYLLGENIKPVRNVGNILFYILLAVLVVIVVVICLLFTRSKKFKVKMRENIIEKNPEYEAPRLVKIYDENVKQELLERQAIAEQKQQEEALEKSHRPKEEPTNIQQFVLGESQDESQKVEENDAVETLATNADIADDEKLKEETQKSDAKPTITAKSATIKAKSTTTKASSTKAKSKAAKPAVSKAKSVEKAEKDSPKA